MKHFLSDLQKSVILFVLLLIVFLLLINLGQAKAGPFTPVVPETVTDDESLPNRFINGSLFHLATFGDPRNPLVIALHGGPGTDYRSMLTLSELQDQFYIIFYDQRGTGLSERVSKSDLTLEKYIDDLDYIVDLYGRGRKANLIGHSFGGQLAVAYVQRFPDKVSRLVLSEPGPLTPEMAEIGPNVMFDPSDPDQLKAFLKAFLSASRVQGPDEDAQKDYFIHQMMINANPGYWCGSRPPYDVPYWRFGYDANSNVTFSIYNVDGDMILDFINGTDTSLPTLFLVSECNTVIGYDFQIEQMNYFSTTEMKMIYGSGHEIFSEKPTESVAAVREFLSR